MSKSKASKNGGKSKPPTLSKKLMRTLRAQDASRTWTISEMQSIAGELRLSHPLEAAEAIAHSQYMVQVPGGWRLGKEPQTLDEEFRNALSMRSGFGDDQFLKLARSGDQDSIAVCAQVAAVILDPFVLSRMQPENKLSGPRLDALVNSLDVNPEMERVVIWLWNALQDMADGVSPNIAFKWAGEGLPEGATPPRKFEDLRREWMIAHWVQGLKEVSEQQGSRISLEEACAQVAAMWSERYPQDPIGDSTARRCYQEFTGVKVTNR